MCGRFPEGHGGMLRHCVLKREAYPRRLSINMRQNKAHISPIRYCVSVDEGANENLCSTFQNYDSISRCFLEMDYMQFIDHLGSFQYK
jgi:hypothetical protein